MFRPALVAWHKPVTLHDKQDAVTASDNAEAMLKPTLDAIAAGERLAEVVERLRKLEWRIAEDDHRVTRLELRLLADFAEPGE